MEHTQVSTMMKVWYAMWGNQLNVTCVGDQKESCTSDQTELQKVVVEEKDEAEALPLVLQLPLHRQTASSEHCDGSICPGWTKEASQ